MATDELTMRRIVAASVVALPWIFVVLTVVASPGYLIPFLQLPVGMGIMLITAFISALSWWVLQRTANKAVWAVIIFFLILPQFATPMMGPACVVIIQALGPTLSGAN